MIVVVLAVHAIAMIVDEAWFHHRRGLPRWERIGHPLDTLTMIACLVWLLVSGPDAVYVALAAASTLFVTKDEWIHKERCAAGEQWLHSLLFALHPVVLYVLAHAPRELVIGQLAITSAFCAYQIVYWNVIADSGRPVDNAWYADLGARWYTATDTPIALLRAEARHRNPWVADKLAPDSRVLDLGCGAGFLANYLAERGHRVIGLDTTPENLEVAARFDRTGRAVYMTGDALSLPFADRGFDAVCAMDLLEHVEEPERLIAEASRVLAPSGLFFFHTFNRTWLANLMVIKGVSWFVKNTPPDLHVLRLFRKPAELRAMLAAHGFELVELHGQRPRFRKGMWRMLATGRVGDDFAFMFTRSTAVGYTGIARKLATKPEPLRQLRRGRDVRIDLQRDVQVPARGVGVAAGRT